MTDEKTVEEAKRFDLIAALQGRTYPKDTVHVWLDEAKMYEFYKASEDALHDPANKDKEKAREALFKEYAGEALTITVQGVAPHVLKAIGQKVRDEFPEKKNGLGQVQPNPEADEAFAQKLWETYVVKIEAPDGSSAVPNEEDIKALRDLAPETAILSIEEAIGRLREGSASGYHQSVQELGFLSPR